jgi:hypothetical protein
MTSGLSIVVYISNITLNISMQMCIHSNYNTFYLLLDYSDVIDLGNLPYFPAYKTHFFPRKMGPKFGMRLMRRGQVLFPNL